MDLTAPSSTAPIAPVTHFDIRSQDVDYAHDELRRTYAEFTVDGAARGGDFQFAHAGTIAPEIVTARTRYAMRAEMDTCPPPQSIIVSTLLGGRMAIDAPTGEPVVAERGMPVLLASDQHRWRVRVDNPYVDAVIVDRATLQQHAASMFGIEPSQLTFTGMTPYTHALGRFWRGVAEHVGHVVFTDAELVANPLVLAETRRLVATAILTAFPNTGRPLAAKPGWVETAVVRRAVDYIEQHCHEPITLTEIAAAARVGERALQVAFRKQQDTTPLGYLRHVRLDRAHRDLVAADPARGDTVQQIAARWGYSNPGRFSSLYLAAYGHSPKFTLRS